MSKTVKLKNGTLLTLELRPFASGGEGDLFKITNPTSFQNQVVKIYKPEKRTKERENKTDFLATNPPSIQIQDGHHSVIWINQVVYDNGQFCGFTMPMAKGEKLELLCHPKLPLTLNGDWSKFDFQNPKAIELRLKLCFNIAVAIYHIHRLNNYVLIDMKPENIIVQPNGLISVIDIDSVAVVKNNKIVFPAPVATPEYTPPEYYKGLKLDRDGVTDTWDRFSMAVIFYRLLCGIHPFTGSCTGQFEKCHGLTDMVQNGLFPNGVRISHFKVIPPPHNNFKKLEAVVQGLFKRCFDDGYNNPGIRPNPDEWCRCLSPQQIIQIKRPLPSGESTFPPFIYSKPITYNPSTKIEVPKVFYSNPTRLKGFRALINGIFGKSKHQKFIELVIQKEVEIKQKELKFISYADDLQGIIKKFNIEQERILQREKSKLEHLKKRYDSGIADADKMAREQHINEANEMRKAAIAYTNAILEVDQKIKLSYSSILTKRYEAHEIQKTSIQNTLANLQLQEQTEMNNLINNPTKLSKYRIEDASIPNIGVTRKRALAAAGILTAADFIDISGDGYFKSRSGKWLKAIGVGWNRAYDLREWQRKLELYENQRISQTVKRAYDNRFAILNNNIRSIDSEFAKEIQPFQAQFNKEKMLHEGEKIKIAETYNQALAQIKVMFDKLQIERNSKAKGFVATTILTELKAIPSETEIELNNNFAVYISQFGTKSKEITSFMENFKIDITNLNTLHEQLAVPKPYS